MPGEVSMKLKKQITEVNVRMRQIASVNVHSQGSQNVEYINTLYSQEFSKTNMLLATKAIKKKQVATGEANQGSASSFLVVQKIRTMCKTIFTRLFMRDMLTS